MSTSARRLAAPVLLVLLGLAALLALAARPPVADAAPTAITTGSLQWGVKESFRKYITGSIAHGSIEVGDGASAQPDGRFSFPVAGGSFESDSGTTAVAFGGFVHFRGHDGQLDMTISDVRVEIAPDGARLLADVSSVPFPAGGAPIVYPDSELGALDVSGVDPVVGGGSTSWSAIPATLTESGAPAFGGFYKPGAVLDPVSFTYAGPGAKPIPEEWTDPGTPGFGDGGHTGNLGGFSQLAVDAANGVIHAATSTGLQAFELDTLKPAGSLAVADLEQIGWAFDPETGTLFARKATGDVLAYAYDGTTYSETEVTGVAGARTLVYDPALDRLYAISTPPPSPLYSGPQGVTVATRNGSGWDVEDYGTIETASRNIGAVALSSNGTLVATYAGLLVSGAIQTQPSVTLADTGAALVATEIPGTAAAAPPGGGMTTGWGNPAAGPGGAVALYETTIGSPVGRLLTLVPSPTDPSGYEVEGGPVDVGSGIRGVTFDSADGSVYVGKDTTILVRRDGEPYATIDSGAGVVRMVGGNGTVYAGSNDTGVLSAYRQVGISPTIDQQPASAAVELPAADAAKQVTFTAGAAGTPAPAVRWQRRAPGGTDWSDLPGETQPTLTVNATGELAGERYRAIFTNAAGAIATSAATLAVTVRPPASKPVSPLGSPQAPPPGLGPPLLERPLAAAAPPRIDGVRRLLRIGSQRVATIATLRCPSGTCRVSVPATARLKVGRTTYELPVKAPRTLRAGRRAAVRLTLPKQAVAALAGRSSTLRLKIAIRSGDQRTVKAVRLKLIGERRAAAASPGPGGQRGDG